MLQNRKIITPLSIEPTDLNSSQNVQRSNKSQIEDDLSHNSEASLLENVMKKIRLCFFLSPLIFVVILTSVFAVVYTAVSPCSFHKCHENATCVSRHLFTAKCECDLGFSGGSVF
jgi:hypothetical protein